jgi:hypothetical protein
MEPVSRSICCQRMSDKLADPQRVPEGHEDEQTVADRAAAIAGGGQQGVDLALRQILALSIISVLGPATAYYRQLYINGFRK